jgi:AraC-like DNA-binding protein
VVHADPQLASALQGYANDIVARFAPEEPPLLRDARRCLLAMLGSCVPSVSVLARQLGLGSRTLQRQLQEAGTSFAGLLDGVRRDAAERAVRNGRTLEDVAQELGFSDPRSLQRAFKRWTNCTVDQYRRRGGS